MQKIRYVLFTVCLLLCGNAMLAQSRSALEDQAYEYLNSGDFVKAYEAFDVLHQRYPKEKDYQFKLGICALGNPEKKARAIEIFLDMRAKEKTREAEYYLAKAYHANYKFDEAINILTPLKATTANSKKKDDIAFGEDVNILMNNCTNGKILVNEKLNVKVVNLGNPINTRELEGVPVITADESMMIFTYVGKKSMGGKVNAMLQADKDGAYTSDIYMSTRQGDTAWSAPAPITALNTKANDAAIALSPDGLTLFTFLSTNENPGDIYVSKLNGTVFTTPEPLNKNVNSPDHWEGSCSISADGKFLYFSSERPEGGLGGRDIWVCEWINDDWGPAVNLGPKVNTPLDEDAPFIHPDGMTLIFSSKGHSSMGGYDIMFTTKHSGDWSEPKSMGVPVNTTEDDSYYVVNSKGDMGYFSSDRSSKDAKGGQDIYMVNPGVIGEKLIVGLFKGIVYGDNTPIEAKIEVLRVDNQETIPYMTNKTTGKYLVTLKPGTKYKVKVTAEGYDPYEEEIDLENLTNYTENKKDVFLYTKAFAASHPNEIKKNQPFLAPAPAIAQEPVKTETPVVQPTDPEPVAVTTPEAKRDSIKAAKAEMKKYIAAVEKAKKDSIKLAKIEAKKKKTEPEPEPEREEPVAVQPCDPAFPDFSEIKGKSLNDVTVYKRMMEIGGKYCADGVVFKVQVGAYRKPENFKPQKLNGLGKIESANYPDGITRFTMKEFRTLQDAEKFRQKAIGRGQSDAWIVVFREGTRYTLEDMIQQDFLNKPIN